MESSAYRRRWLQAYGRSLTRRHAPRLEMFLILSATSASGFLASRVLLHHGLLQVVYRYPLSAMIAYACFFALVGMWVRLYASRELPRDADFSEPARAGTSGGFPFDVLDAPDFLDEGLFPFVLVVVALALLVMAAFVIADAPVLLAELLLESSLVGALYPALRSTPRIGWQRFLWRRTVVPILVVVTVFTILAMGMQAYAPEARSIGEVFRHASARP